VALCAFVTRQGFFYFPANRHDCLT